MMRRLTALSMIVLALACRHKREEVQLRPGQHWVDVGRACTPDSPAFPLPESLRDTSVHPFRMAGRDRWEEKAKIARTIPGGWGGIGHRRETHPRTIVYLVDTTQFAAAVPALVAAGFLAPNPIVAPVQGRWSYDQLYDWFRYIYMNIRGVGVTGWALDDSRNRIFFALEDQAAERALSLRLAEMNAPCFLVAVDIWGRIQMRGRGAVVERKNISR